MWALTTGKVLKTWVSCMWLSLLTFPERQRLSPMARLRVGELYKITCQAHSSQLPLRAINWIKTLEIGRSIFTFKLQHLLTVDDYISKSFFLVFFSRCYLNICSLSFCFQRLPNVFTLRCRTSTELVEKRKLLSEKCPKHSLFLAFTPSLCPLWLP